LLLDLTIDVGVVMSGSGLGDPKHSADSLELLKAVESEKGWHLALDERGRILHQYQEKVKQGFGRDWIRRLASSGKIIHVPWQRMNRGIRTALIEVHFDPEDYKYAETASHTGCKVLVAHDDDYSIKVRRVLRRVSVDVISARRSLDLKLP
jgi:hypothetical protein